MTSYRRVPRRPGDAGIFAGYAGRAEAWAPSVSAGLLADGVAGLSGFGACRAVLAVSMISCRAPSRSMISSAVARTGL
jgi:hypothetical protein